MQKEIYTLSVSLVKKEGGKFKKKIVYNLNNLCLSFSRDCHQSNVWTGLQFHLFSSWKLQLTVFLVFFFLCF